MHEEGTAKILNCWLFLCGALTTFDIQIIGRISVAELLVSISIPILFLTRKVIFWNGNFLKCTAILITMTAATILADHYNGFYFELSARAFARPVFIFGFMIFFTLVLERAPKSLAWFIYGLVVASIINYFRPSEFTSDDIHDASTYGGVVFLIEPMAHAATLAACTWLWPKTRLAVAGVITITIGILAWLGSSRSGLLIYILSLFIILALMAINQQSRRRFSLSRNRLIGLGISSLAALTITYLGYISLAPAGILGEEQRTKFEMQSASPLGASPLGFIMSGRTQVYGAILGIKERPITGFGSWRHDLTSVYVMDALQYVGSDPQLIDRINKHGKAPAAGHSVLFQAWVENGLVPALCWMAIGWIVLLVSLYNLKNNTLYTPFFIIIGVGFAWDFLFSPPAVSLRYLTGIYMAYFIVFMDSKRPLRNARELT